VIAAELVDDAKAVLGEGPVWHAEEAALYWLDIVSSRLHRYDPVTARSSAVKRDAMVTAAVPAVDGGMVAATRRGFGHLDPRTGAVTPQHEVIGPDAALRMNDGKCDATGRLWAGSMTLSDERGNAALYRLEPDGHVVAVITGLSLSNGMAWTGDGTAMFHIDTYSRRVDAYDFDEATGAVSGRRAVVELGADPGFPDGMAIDDEGCIWVALWGAGRVQRFSPGGERLASVSLPVSEVTSCAFGGHDGGTLFITSARERLDPEALGHEPLAGGLFHCRPGVTGPPPQLFGSRRR
jgi:sugar lactone lactonase YvrE